MLKEFARRLTASVRATDTVARLSDDEFVIIFEDLYREQEVTAVAAKIADAVRVPFELGNVRLAVTASVGVALYRGHGQSHQALLANADSAVYTAKPTAAMASAYMAGRCQRWPEKSPPSSSRTRGPHSCEQPADVAEANNFFPQNGGPAFARTTG